MYVITSRMCSCAHQPTQLVQLQSSRLSKHGLRLDKPYTLLAISTFNYQLVEP